jgi:hypothetical protein
VNATNVIKASGLPISRSAFSVRPPAAGYSRAPPNVSSVRRTSVEGDTLLAT